MYNRCTLLKLKAKYLSLKSDTYNPNWSSDFFSSELIEFHPVRAKYLWLKKLCNTTITTRDYWSKSTVLCTRLLLFELWHFWMAAEYIKSRKWIRPHEGSFLLTCRYFPVTHFSERKSEIEISLINSYAEYINPSLLFHGNVLFLTYCINFLRSSNCIFSQSN